MHVDICVRGCGLGFVVMWVQIQGSWFRDEGSRLRFRIQILGFRIRSSEFRVQSMGLIVEALLEFGGCTLKVSVYRTALRIEDPRLR